MKPLPIILGLLVSGNAAAVLAASNGLPKQFVQLHGDDIRSIIVGGWQPDWSLKQSVIPYYESFDANGVWQSARGERGPHLLEGLWTIKGDNLCVKIIKDTRGKIGALRCRPVWRSPASGVIAMTDMGSGVEGDAVVVLSPLPSKHAN